MSPPKSFSARAVVLACAGAVALFGCKGKPGGAALLATVEVQDPLAPTCVVFEVSANGATRFTQTLVDDGSKKQFKIGIEQGDLPGTVQLRAFASRSAKGCDQPRLVLSASPSVDGKFPTGGVGQVSLTISAQPPADLDADGDGHVAASAGGDDCNDHDAAAHPGATQDCASSSDTDCNGQAGCLDAACMSQGVCAGGATSLAFNTNPVTAAPGSCAGPLTVGLRNAAAMPVAATAPVTVTFTTQPTGLSFFSDSACTSPAISQTIAANQSAATVYFSGAAAGSYLVTASAAALASAQQTETLSSQSATQLAFSSPARTVTAGQCSQQIDLQTRDVSGNVVPVANAMQVALTASQSGVAFYADANCTTALPGAVVPFSAGSSSAKFYVEATQALATMLTASFTGLSSATQALTVDAAAADHLVFVTQPMGVMSAQCSGAVLLEARDAFENPALPAAGQMISLTETGPSGFTFFTDSACTTALTGMLPFTSGTPQAHYYFSGTTAGTATMTADSAPFPAISQDATIGVGPPAALVFTSGPQSAPSVTCSSAPVVVQVRDATGNPVTVTATNGPIPVTLSAAPSAGFTLYADAGCATALTGNQLMIPVGSSSASFWFKGTTVGPVVVTAASTPLMQDMQTESIVAGPPAQLVFTSPLRTSPAGQCTQFDLAALDSQGNAATVGADTTIALSSSPATVSFFSAPGCAVSSSATSVTMTMGNGTVSFYASGTSAGAPQLTATAPFGGADQVFTVQGGAPTALAITTPPQLGILSDACSGQITVELHDAFGNVTQAGVQTDVTLSSTATGPFNFYQGGNCGGSPVTVSSIAAGSSSTTVSFKGRKAEAFNLAFTSPSLTQATQGASIVAGAASQLVFTTPSRFGVSAGVCSPVVTLQRLDAYGNVATGPALSLSVSATGSAQLFSDGACTTGAGGVASFGAGADHTDLYFSDTVAEGFQIDATGTGVGGASQLESTTGGGPSQLVYLTAPQTADAGTCSGVVTVQRRDMNGNPSSPNAATTVTLAWGGNGAMGFFADPGCGTALTGSSFDIQANQSNGQFYFSSTTAETNTVTASASLLSPALQLETIAPGPPAKLAFTSPAQTVDALVCSVAQVTVQSQDTFGNPSKVAAATTVNLSATGTAAPGTFSVTANSCSPAVTTVPIASGGTNASFYFYGASSGTLTIGAQAAGLGPMVTQDETVRSAPAKQLALSSSASPAEAGACALVTVTREDQNGNPTAPNNSTTVSLSVLPSSGLSFFSDASCATPATQVTIASGQPSASYYLKGLTGGTGSTALTYSLGATAPGLTAGSLNFDVLQMVRRGTCTLADNANSATCAVAPAIPNNDISRTFLVYQGSDIYSEQDRDDVECHLASTATAVNVVCTRQGNPGSGAPPAVTVSWQTVSNAHDASVAGGWSVQHLTGSFSNNSTNNPLTAALASPVTVGQTFTWSATSESGTANRAVGFLTAELSANNVVLTQGGGGNKYVNSGTYALEVVSMNGAIVNRGTRTPGTTGGSFTASATTPDTTRTALLFSARTDDSGTTLDAMCKRRFRGVITNGTTLTFTRGNGAGGACTSNNVEAICWEEIIFPTGTLVQPLSITVNAASATGSGALGTPVDPTRTLLFMPGHGPGGASAGETTYTTSDALGTTVGTPAFVNSSTVQVTRPLLVANSTVYSVFAVQFSP